MELLAAIQLSDILGTIFYTFLGFGLLVACWWIVERVTPFSLRKEIEEDQNMAIAVLIAALFLSLAIIIAAVILS